MSPKLRYTETPETGSEDYRKILRLLPYLMVYRGRVLLAMLALILAKFATVGVPFILKDIVDSFMLFSMSCIAFRDRIFQVIKFKALL